MSTENEIVEQEEVSPEDEFANAFAELTEPGETPVSEEETPVSEEETPVSEEETPVIEEETPANEEETPVNEEEKTDFAGELAKLREELKKPEEVVEEPEVAPTPLLSEEETKFLQEYDADWPDISKAEAIKRKVEIRQAVEYVFAQMQQAMNPLMDKFRETEYNQHEAALLAAHNDYNEVKDDVISWVGQQQGVRGKLFGEVVKAGTVDEISELVTIWKEATGKTKPQVSGAASTPVPTEPPAKAKQAAQKLSVVSSKRTSVPAVSDPNDFDSAWSDATGR